MSIASEITRLQNAKSSIKTAIEGKGVEVPSTTKLDGYGELITSIPSGGDAEWGSGATDGSITILGNFQSGQSVSNTMWKKFDGHDWDTHNCTRFTRFFFQATNLVEADILNFDTTSAASAFSLDFFGGCTNLEIVRFGEKLLYSPNHTTISIGAVAWTHDSMIESLYTNQLNRDTTNAKTVTLHATAKARLSDAEKANIAALGITIA